jgi:hypothetical protein
MVSWCNTSMTISRRFCWVFFDKQTSSIWVKAYKNTIRRINDKTRAIQYTHFSMNVGNKHFNHITYLSKQSHLVVQITYITKPTPPDTTHTRGTNHAMLGAYVKGVYTNFLNVIFRMPHPYFCRQLFALSFSGTYL